ncbi:hypothetical protein ScPMuIL_014331 [Solemya velum]
MKPTVGDDCEGKAKKHLNTYFYSVSTEDENFTDEWIIKIAGNKKDAVKLAADYSMTFLRKLPVPGYFLFKKPEEKTSDVSYTESMISSISHNPQILAFQQQKYHRRVLKAYDPMWEDMWFYNGKVQPSLKIIEAWDLGYSGKSIIIAVVDDGIETDHPDLYRNVNTSIDYDFVENDDDVNPSPNYEYNHGTYVSGFIAAEKFNNECMSGIAYNSTLVGVRIMDSEKNVTDAQEGDALIHELDTVDIYSNSWGPDDDGIGYEGPSLYVRDAIAQGIQSGRNGLGAIYVWAAGNGGTYDNCNADGYANSIYTITISSYGKYGGTPWFSEVCAPNMAVTYGDFLFSTDTQKGCGGKIAGTSFSTAMATGIIALTLEANANLTWRDVQHLIVLTTKKYDLADDSYIWQRNGAGKLFNQRLGFGLMDAEDMVLKSLKWITVPEQKLYTTPLIPVDSLVSFENPVLSTMNSIFGGENPLGIWKLTMDMKAPHVIGQFVSWQLSIYGTELNPIPAGLQGRDYCQNASCDNNGTCYNRIYDYTCDCPANYTGYNCHEPVCLAGCQGKCERPGECQCGHNWQGEFCDQCVPHPLCRNGNCTAFPFDTCACYEGWTGRYCNIDLNFCENNLPCLNNGTCTNGELGWYTCQCPSEYTGPNCDTYLCDGDYCLNQGTCVHRAGENITCLCRPEFTGEKCEDQIDPCQPDPCEIGKICRVTMGSYECHCNISYGNCNDIATPTETSTEVTIVSTTQNITEATTQPVYRSSGSELMARSQQRFLLLLYALALIYSVCIYDASSDGVS